MATIHFRAFNRTVEVPDGTTILDAALANDIELKHLCPNVPECGACRVLIVKGFAVSVKDEWETRVCAAHKYPRNFRLACRTQVLGEITVDVPMFHPSLAR